MANNEKNKINDETKKKISADDVLEFLDKALGKQYGTKEQAKMVYLLSHVYELEEAKLIYNYCKELESFEHIDAVATLYSCIKSSFDMDNFRKFVADVYGTTRKAETLDEIVKCLRYDLGADRVGKFVDTFSNDEEMLLSALRIARRIFNMHAEEDLYNIVLQCKSKPAMIAALELYQRGSSYEEVAAILLRYRYNGGSQVTALKQEILKRKIAGTIRDNFRYYV